MGGRERYARRPPLPPDGIQRLEGLEEDRSLPLPALRGRAADVGAASLGYRSRRADLDARPGCGSYSREGLARLPEEDGSML